MSARRSFKALPWQRYLDGHTQIQPDEEDPAFRALALAIEKHLRQGGAGPEAQDCAEAIARLVARGQATVGRIGVELSEGGLNEDGVPGAILRLIKTGAASAARKRRVKAAKSEKPLPPLPPSRPEWRRVAHPALPPIPANLPATLAMPPELSPKGKEAWRAVVGVLLAHDLTSSGGYNVFSAPYPHAQERGVMLSVATHGDVRDAFQGGGAAASHLIAALDDIGLYAQQYDSSQATILVA